MEYFKSLISKIEELEGNFIVINSRIIEFGKSTDYEHVDFSLVAKYHKNLTSYLEFVEEEKKNLGKGIKVKSKQEFLAAKKIVEVRINELIKQIGVVLKRLSKILKIKKAKLPEKEVEVLFKSSGQMEDIKGLLMQFNDELEVYKNVQKLLGITIDLDDNIEKEIEENSTNEEILQRQRYFMESSGDFLENILDYKSSRFSEITKRKDNVFLLISKKDYYDKLFFSIFKKKYTIGLEIEKSSLAMDYENFELFNSKLDILLDISDFCKNYDKVLKESIKYGFENYISVFMDTNIFLQEKILNRKRFNLEELMQVIDKEIGIKKLKSLLFYIDSLSEVMKMYKNFKKIDFSIIDGKYNLGFIEFFKKDITGEKLITNFIKEHSISVVSRVWKQKIKLSNIVKNKNIFSDIADELSDLYKALIDQNKKIDLYSYPSPRISLDKKLILNADVFDSIKVLKAYYSHVVYKVYKLEKKAYLVRQRSSYSGGSSRSSGSSYSSGSSSSSWSSSSSSGSSSYSSSGSSSW